MGRIRGVRGGDSAEDSGLGVEGFGITGDLCEGLYNVGGGAAEDAEGEEVEKVVACGGNVEGNVEVREGEGDGCGEGGVGRDGGFGEGGCEGLCEVQGDGGEFGEGFVGVHVRACCCGCAGAGIG